MKNEKVLGTGQYGCVIKPSIVCNQKNKYKNKMVSKILNNENLNEEDKIELDKEFIISQKLQKIDPNNEFFIGGIEQCDISSKLISKTNLKECDLPTDKEINLRNIIMPLGEDFYKITEQLSEEDLLKSLGHLLVGIRKLKSKMALFDIKFENLLFTPYHKDNKYMHPAFIDFGPLFIVTNKNEYKTFIKMFGAHDYFVWPLEIILSMYVKDKKKTNEQKDKIKKHLDTKFHYKKNEKMKKEDVTKYDKYIKDHFVNAMEKCMVYQIANCFSHLTEKKNFLEKLKPMINNNYTKRYNISKSIRYVNRLLKEINPDRKQRDGYYIDHSKYSEFALMKLFKKLLFDIRAYT
jgi:hypothetical protein